jgi:putative transposase
VILKTRAFPYGKPFLTADLIHNSHMGLFAGKPLNGDTGIFAPLLRHFLEAAIAGELEAHLQEEKAAGKPNRKNGKTSKTSKKSPGGSDL